MAPKRGSAPVDTNKYLSTLSIDEDFWITDIRLAMAVTACCASILALVVDYLFPYPMSHTFLLGCVALYFLLMTAQTIFMIIVQKNYIFFGLSNAKGVRYKWKLASDLRRFQDEYRLELICEDPKQNLQRKSEMKKPFSKFFDIDGLFDESGFHTEMRALVDSVSLTRKQQ